MSTRLPLRIASVLTIIHALLHTFGSVVSHPPAGPQQAAALAMQTGQFQIMGLTRTYWDFHLGFALAIGIMLLVEGIVFWQLGTLAAIEVRRLRPILGTFLAGYLGIAVVSWKFFFAPPVITEALIALCLSFAYAGAGRHTLPSDADPTKVPAAL